MNRNEFIQYVTWNSDNIQCCLYTLRAVVKAL